MLIRVREVSEQLVGHPHRKIPFMGRQPLGRTNSILGGQKMLALLFHQLTFFDWINMSDTKLEELAFAVSDMNITNVRETWHRQPRDSLKGRGQIKIHI